MMQNLLKKIKYLVVEKHPSISIIIIFNAVIIAVALIFYLLLPVILNYPPESIKTRFEIDVVSLSYNTQFLIIVGICVSVGTVLLKRVLIGIDDQSVYLAADTPENSRKISRIRKKCLSLPYGIYIFQIIFPVFVIASILILIRGYVSLVIIKIIILVFSFGTLAALISLIFSKRIFTRILLKTYRGGGKEGRVIGLRAKIFLQILPMFIVAILFTSMIGYSRLVNDKGELLYDNYMLQLKNNMKNISVFSDIGKVYELLAKIKLKKPGKDCTFVVSPEGKVKTSNGEVLSNFFIHYMNDISPRYGGRVYDIYAVDTRGVIVSVRVNDSSWRIGIKYDVAANNTVTFFIISFFILLALNTFVLSYFSKSIEDDISLVAKSLTEIAEGGDIDLEKKLAVTSNDEIGDLVIAFNKIQELEKENIRSIKENQAILMEQERLASLGQLIGGIAHNLKTPIMSLSGGIEALKDLAKEYNESIGDENVTADDHHEIAGEMITWLDKMKPYCTYMSDIISAVKGQAVQLSASTSSKFTLDELIKRVDILMKHELKKYHCTINKDFQVDMTTELKGEVNNLVQIFDNIIINAIQSYEEESGIIDFIIKKDGNNMEFIIRDYGKGILPEVKNKLFKEMVTTKGKNGTGLGLFMSYATIKGRFGGNMRFVSEVGKGTTFHISIPYIKSAMQQEVL